MTDLLRKRQWAEETELKASHKRRRRELTMLQTKLETTIAQELQHLRQKHAFELKAVEKPQREQKPSQICQFCGERTTNFSSCVGCRKVICDDCDEDDPETINDSCNAEWIWRQEQSHESLKKIYKRWRKAHGPLSTSSGKRRYNLTKTEQSWAEEEAYEEVRQEYESRLAMSKKFLGVKNEGKRHTQWKQCSGALCGGKICNDCAYRECDICKNIACLVCALRWDKCGGCGKMFCKQYNCKYYHREVQCSALLWNAQARAMVNEKSEEDFLVGLQCCD